VIVARLTRYYDGGEHFLQVFDLFVFFLLLQYILVRCLLRPTLSLSFCTIAKYLLRFESPYYSYASPIAFGSSSATTRAATRKCRTPPGRFYIDVRPSVPSLRDNLLGVNCFSTFLILLFRRRTPISLPLVVTFVRAMRRFVSINQSVVMFRND
jgi:hypothetical protein